jgi:hypothetical protein
VHLVLARIEGVAEGLIGIAPPFDDRRLVEQLDERRLVARFDRPENDAPAPELRRRG